MHPSHLGIAQRRPGSVKPRSRVRASVAILAREREVDLVGDNVCQAIELECALMGDHGKVRTGLNPGGGDLLEWRARIETESIEASCRPLQATTLMGLRTQAIAVHADCLGLARGDVSGLPFGHPAEGLPGLLVSHLR